jgi:hypothetical protein
VPVWLWILGALALVALVAGALAIWAYPRDNSF